MARYAKLGAKKRAAYLEALRQGARRGMAAEAVGINRETMRTYCKAFPDYAAQVDQAEMEANELVVDALYMAATSGNVVACQVWLYNRMPDQWQDKRNVSAEIKGEIMIRKYVGVDVDKV